MDNGQTEFTFRNTTTAPVASLSSTGTLDTTALSTSSTVRIDANGALQNISNFVGVILPFAGSVVPTGWLLCAGQNVSRSTYAALFTAIQTTYGAGDGSSTFALPDLRGRVVAGLDNMNGTAVGRLTGYTALGTNGGVESVTLTSTQCALPSHSHTATDSGHSHTYDRYQPGVGSTGTFGKDGVTYTYGYTYTANNASGTGYANITVQSTSIANASSSHTNIQPTIVLNYIIKV